MQIELNEVYSIKIANGDELVAKVLAQDETTVTVSDPLTVIPGQHGLQLMPSLFTANPKSAVTINTSNISMLASVIDEVRDRYVEVTTGIAPVRNKILMG
jgi:hypothetical protein